MIKNNKTKFLQGVRVRGNNESKVKENKLFLTCTKKSSCIFHPSCKLDFYPVFDKKAELGVKQGWLTYGQPSNVILSYKIICAELIKSTYFVTTILKCYLNLVFSFDSDN